MHPKARSVFTERALGSLVYPSKEERCQAVVLQRCKYLSARIGVCVYT